MELTRRHILAGSAGLAAAPLLPAITANAAAPMADKQAPSFYRYKVGDVQVTVISDGVNTFPLGDSFVLNAKKDEVAAALEKAYMPKDKVSIQFGPLVINSGGIFDGRSRMADPTADSEGGGDDSYAEAEYAEAGGVTVAFGEAAE